MRLWAIIPAAGRGARAGGDKPKQYQNLAGMPMLLHTIKALAQVNGISSCVIALAADDNYFAYLNLPDNLKLDTTTGGRERSDSVLNTLEFLLENGANDKDWVLVHDAARPLVNPSDIENLLGEIADSDVGGILALPLSDTLKEVKDGVIIKTRDRSRLWQALTPQVFRLDILYNALKVAKKNKVIVTDEAQAVELQGLKPKVVAGSRANIKLTYPEDFVFAEFILTNT